MPTALEVLFTPAEFNALASRDLGQTVCVVFDVLRATTTMVSALGNGAAAVIPVAEIPEALALRRQRPDLLLAGERDGLRIGPELTGGVGFDLGNSPREFTRDKVAGRTIVTTTTNGTRALRACVRARQTLVCSLLNLRVTADWLLRERPRALTLICSGTFEEAAYEDALAAGALCRHLWPAYADGEVADSARMALRLYQQAESDLAAAVATSRNARHLLTRPELAADVEFCLQRDVQPLVAVLNPAGQVVVASPAA